MTDKYYAYSGLFCFVFQMKDFAVVLHEFAGLILIPVVWSVCGYSLKKHLETKSGVKSSCLPVKYKRSLHICDDTVLWYPFFIDISEMNLLA